MGRPIHGLNYNHLMQEFQVLYNEIPKIGLTKNKQYNHIVAYTGKTCASDIRGRQYELSTCILKVRSIVKKRLYASN